MNVDIFKPIDEDFFHNSHLSQNLQIQQIGQVHLVEQLILDN